jgi:pimeloyl-ACP methyl ester carboxylesterase
MRLRVDGCEAFAYTGSRPLAQERACIVFVHGAANDHSVWGLQSRYFAHHGHNVLAVDLPGHGRSEGAALTSIEALADWIVTFLDAANVRMAALVGHSMGSLAVLEAAARYPERVARLALLAPAAPMRVSEALLAAAKADDHVAYEMINAWSFSAARQLGGNTVPGVWMTGNAMRLMERTRGGVLHADLCACNAYTSAVAAAVAVRCPALLLLGARDVMAPPRSAQGLAAALPKSRVTTLALCGHAMMSEQPDAVLDALRAFL